MYLIITLSLNDLTAPLIGTYSPRWHRVLFVLKGPKGSMVVSTGLEINGSSGSKCY